MSSPPALHLHLCPLCVLHKSSGSQFELCDSRDRECDSDWGTIWLKETHRVKHRNNGAIMILFTGRCSMKLSLKWFLAPTWKTLTPPLHFFLWSLTSGMHPRISLSLLRIMQVEIISSGMCWFCPAGVIGIYIFKSFLSLLTQRVWKKRYASFVWAIDLKRNPQLVFTFILERKNPPPLPPSAFGTKTYLYK